MASIEIEPTADSIRASSSNVSSQLGAKSEDLAFSSGSTTIPRSFCKLSDGVYIVNASTTKPSHEFIFFHGFELEDSNEEYWKHWLSADGSHSWLTTWLVEEFPNARVVSVAYDSCLNQTPESGRMDLYNITENVMTELVTLAKVGQDNCPVVLVGYCLGGLIMKSLIVAATRKNHVDQEDSSLYANFLENVKGLFFFSTPHAGSEISTESSPSPLQERLKILNIETARLNEEFSAVLSKFRWLNLRDQMSVVHVS